MGSIFLTHPLLSYPCAWGSFCRQVFRRSRERRGVRQSWACMTSDQFIRRDRRSSVPHVAALAYFPLQSISDLRRVSLKTLGRRSSDGTVDRILTEVVIGSWKLLAESAAFPPRPPTCHCTKLAIRPNAKFQLPCLCNS